MQDRNVYQASFTVEASFLISFFCIVICSFLFLIMVQYDLVVLQTNKLYMQYEQMTESDMEAYANRGCILFQQKTCEQRETPIKIQFEITFHAKNGSLLFEEDEIETQMCGEWEKMCVTENVRLISTCMDLLR